MESHQLHVLSDAISLRFPALFAKFSDWIRQREALGAFSLWRARSPSLDPQPTPPNSISRLAALEGSRQHAEIWKVLKQPAGGGGAGSRWPGGGGGIVKTGGWGRKETECKIVLIPPFCLALFPLSSHIDVHPQQKRIQTTP